MRRMTPVGHASADLKGTHTMATREPIDSADAYAQMEAAAQYEADWLAAFIHNILCHSS